MHKHVESTMVGIGLDGSPRRQTGIRRIWQFSPFLHGFQIQTPEILVSNMRDVIQDSLSPLNVESRLVYECTLAETTRCWVCWPDPLPIPADMKVGVKVIQNLVGSSYVLFRVSRDTLVVFEGSLLGASWPRFAPSLGLPQRPAY